MIHIHILGSAAGGGLPQWNCACHNCVAARSGKIPPQTQSSIAISSDSFPGCFLINASPDLSRQIEMLPQLQPRPATDSGFRNSPVAGIFLTNTDLDHALGILLLREQETPLVVYAADQVRMQLGWIDDVLSRFRGVEWRKTESTFQSLSGAVTFRTIQLARSVAFQFHDADSGATALFAPSVGQITAELRSAIDDSNVIVFDGTFWSDGELAMVRKDTRRAREMNHLPINDGTLGLLHQSPARRKIYTHINNTNPILMPGSPERTQVEQAGIEIARDGLEIML